MDRPVSVECYLRALRSVDKYESISWIMIPLGIYTLLC